LLFTGAWRLFQARRFSPEPLALALLRGASPPTPRPGEPASVPPGPSGQESWFIPTVDGGCCRCAKCYGQLLVLLHAERLEQSEARATTGTEFRVFA
jgi:hypothetical protein